jgi:hypothetical protein
MGICAALDYGVMGTNEQRVSRQTGKAVDWKRIAAISTQRYAPPGIQLCQQCRAVLGAHEDI